MPRSTIKKNYIEHLGVNLKLDELNSNSVYAESAQNCILGPKGEIRKRPGSTVAFNSGDPITAVCRHIEIDPFNGKESVQTIIQEDLSPSADSVALISRKAITITSSAVNPQIQVTNDTNTVSMYEGGILQYSTSSASTIASITSFINSQPNWTATSSPDHSYGNSLETTPLIDVSGEMSLFYYNREDITEGTSATFPNTDLTDLDFQPLSSTTINGATYIAQQNGDIWKYINRNIYKAGMGEPTLSSSSVTAGSGQLNAGETVALAVIIRQTDPSGNIVDGPVSYTRQLIGGGNNAIALNISYSGDLGNQEFTTGASASSGVITCSSSAEASKFKVGDYVIMSDTSNNYIAGDAHVTSVSGTQVTTDGSFTIGSGMVTKGVEAYVYRAIGDFPSFTPVPGPYYQEARVPLRLDGTVISALMGFTTAENLSTKTTLDIKTWTDGLPKGRVITTYQRKLVISGNPKAPGEVWFADLDGQEQFDAARSFFLVDGSVTALGPTREQLAVFKERDCDIITGDLFSYSFRVDQADGDIGCVSNNSVQVMSEGTLYFLSHRGPYKVENGFVSPLGEHVSRSGDRSSILEPFFNRLNDSERYTGTSGGEGYYAFRKATSAKWQHKNLYMVSIPYERRSDPGFPFTFADDGPITWVYDYDRGVWMNWKDMEVTAGMSPIGDTVLCGTSGLRFMDSSGSRRNFTDDGTSIYAEYKPLWDNFGEPSVYKKAVRLKVHFRGDIDSGHIFLFDQDAPVSSLSISTQHDFDSDTDYLGLTSLAMLKNSDVKVKLKGKMRQWRPVFTCATDEDWSIMGWDAEIVAPYARTIK